MDIIKEILLMYMYNSFGLKIQQMTVDSEFALKYLDDSLSLYLRIHLLLYLSIFICVIILLIICFKLYLKLQKISSKYEYLKEFVKAKFKLDLAEKIEQINALFSIKIKLKSIVLVDTNTETLQKILINLTFIYEESNELLSRDSIDLKRQSKLIDFIESYMNYSHIINFDKAKFKYDFLEVLND